MGIGNAQRTAGIGPAMSPGAGPRIIMGGGISTRGLDGFGFRRRNGRRRGFAGGEGKGMSVGRRCIRLQDLNGMK